MKINNRCVSIAPRPFLISRKLQLVLSREQFAEYFYHLLTNFLIALG